jgi:MraZ protein
MFLSKFNFKVDRKGRLSVPADYRAALSQQSFAGILAFASFTDPAIRGCGIDLMEKISATRDPLAVFGPTPIDLTLAAVPEVTQLPFDGEGRIVLPEHLREHATIADQAMFVGRLNYFEIWQPAAFAQHQEVLRASMRANANALLPTTCWRCAMTAFMSTGRSAVAAMPRIGWKPRHAASSALIAILPRSHAPPPWSRAMPAGSA